MKRQWFSIVVTGLMVAGLFQAIVASLPLNALRKMANTGSVLAQPAQVGATPITGAYNGQVKLKWSLGGVYSDTLAIPTPQPAGTPALPDLGSIDLGLQLNQSDNAISGYVVLTNTLVFTREHTITVTPGAAPIDTGPTVQGTFDGVNLTLTAERVKLVVAGRPIERQFRLTGAIDPNDATLLTGEYRETVWGYTPQPMTVVGAFTLQRPAFGTTAPPTANSYKLYLPAIQR